MSAHCTDPLIGNILAGWRYDISHLSLAMRSDYDGHLVECAHCRHRQRVARTVDVLLLSVSTLSFCAFLLAVAVLRRIETLAHLSNKVHGHVYHTPITISLEAAAVAGLLVSLFLWVLIASVTPITGIVSEAVQQRLPQSVRERLMKNAA
ncbi:MAG TPA: hypothetical protein VG714_10230 [Acidobacteriaceae bacterium]|nr:hypothetical protein [Acidobacteriaceae bacterium]